MASFPSGILLTNVHSREPRFDFLRKRSRHPLTTVLRSDQRFDQIKILCDFMTMSEVLTLSTLSKRLRNRIILVHSIPSTVHSVPSRRQLIALVQCIHNQLGKSICYQWQENTPKKSYKSIRPEVHKFAYSQQSRNLLALIKDLKNPKKPFDPPIIKARLIDILAVPVDLPYSRKMLRGEDEYCSNLSLAAYFRDDFLDDTHVLHNLVCSPVLLPNSFHDLVPMAKEQCLNKMLAPVHSRIGNEYQFDTIIEGVIKRCYAVGLQHLIPKLWEQLSCKGHHGEPDPIKKLEAQFDYYIATDNQAEALELAVDWPLDTTRSFNSDSDRNLKVEQTLLPFAQRGNEARAFELVLTHPKFRHAFSRIRLRDYEEMEVRGANFGNDFNPLKMVAALLIITCHLRGIDGTINVAKGIPVDQARNYAINHLILRLAHPRDYWRIWQYYIKEYTMPKKEMNMEDITEGLAKLQMSLTAAMMGIRMPTREETCPITQDIEKAIMLFKTYPTVESEDMTPNCLIQRSIYLFAALWNNGNRRAAREYLETILTNSRFISEIRKSLKNFDIQFETVITHYGIDLNRYESLY